MLQLKAWAALGLLVLVAAMGASPVVAQTILFNDDFEDGGADGWTVYQGTWSIVQDGTYVYRQPSQANKFRVGAGASTWTDYAVQARVKPTSWNGQDRYVALLARVLDGSNHYALALRGSNKVELKKITSSSSARLAIATLPVSLDTWYTLRLEVTGSTIRGYVNGVLKVSATDATFASGRIGARTEYATANFDDFLVTTASPPPPPPPPPAPNQPPQVQAGPDQTVILPAVASLSGQVTDDGKPNPPATVTCTWSQDAGPGFVSFSPNPNARQALASFSVEGNYTLRLACSDSQLEAFDVVNVTVLPESPAPPPPAGGPVGWASVDAWGQNGTTGGAAGPTVTVSTATEFLDYIARSGPYVIQVNGLIALPGPMHNVTSDKTIIGLGSNSGISGGGLNIGLNVNNNVTAPPPNAVKNVIIRNLIFTNFPDDAINVQMFSHHIWIDHNELSNANDGLIDIKRGSSYITVSWNHTHHHVKNMLLGHDDGNGAQDIGRLKVTYHHNWFDATPQRNPRVRFGEPVHVFNNYYSANSDVGVACQADGGCWVEGNYFENVPEPMTPNYAGPSGRIVETLNVYMNSGPPVVLGAVQDPSVYYTYTLDNAADVKAIVMDGAGVGR